MEEKINQRIAWIEQRVELSELAKEYIAFQMMQFAKYYHEQQVKSVDLAQVGKPWSEMKDGDEMILRCRKVKGKFELCSE